MEAVVVLLATAPAQPTNNFLTYVNTVNKITIRYPSIWTKTEFAGNPSIPVMFNAPVTTTATPNTGARQRLAYDKYNSFC